MKRLWFKIRIAEPKPALKLWVRLSSSEWKQHFRPAPSPCEHKPQSYGWHCWVMSLQSFEPGIQSWSECVPFTASTGTSIRKGQTPDPQHAGLLSRELICCWRCGKHLLAVLVGLLWGTGAAMLHSPQTLEVQLLLRQSQGIHRDLCVRAGAACNLDILEKQWREDDLEINFLNKQKALVLPASSICSPITHPPASLQVWKGLKHDIEIYTVVDFLSFAHFHFLFGWLLSFYGLCTEALPCSNLFLWPHTSKTTVALGCNLKGGRIPSTAWEARMWFVTEICQVTFPLIPIFSKLSSAQHLTQKCPFASLILCRKGYLQKVLCTPYQKL